MKSKNKKKIEREEGRMCMQINADGGDLAVAGDLRKTSVKTKNKNMKARRQPTADVCANENWDADVIEYMRLSHFSLSLLWFILPATCLIWV